MKVHFSLHIGNGADFNGRISESEELSGTSDSKLDDSRGSLEPTPMVEPNSIMVGVSHRMQAPDISSLYPGEKGSLEESLTLGDD
jgi:hypothetical protein